MSESLIITTKKDNTLEFEAEVRGVKDPNMNVQFVIQAGTMNLAFPAKHEKEQTWSVTIPAMDFLEHKEYPFMITVDLEGYHFEPMTGELTVVGEMKPVVSKPKPVSNEKKEEAKKEEPKPEPKKQEVKEEPKKEEKVEEPKKEKSETVKKDDKINKTVESIIQREKLRKSPKDVAVRKVLGEFKAAPKKEEVEPPVTMEDVLAPSEEEQQRAAKEAAIRAILSQVGKKN
jgi:hypothetical protein